MYIKKGQGLKIHLGKGTQVFSGKRNTQEQANI